MKVLEPYRTLSGFLKAFDNGGRFWSVGAQAGDGVVTKGELAKATAALHAGRGAVLSFELLRGFLGTAEAEAALASLDAKARRRWKQHAPRRCAVGEALAQRIDGAVLFQAEPTPASDEDARELTTTMVVPVGKALIPVVVPLESRYRLWRLDGARGPGAVVLGTRSKRLDLAGRRLVIAAVVRATPTATGNPKRRRRWLEGVAACEG